MKLRILVLDDEIRIREAEKHPDDHDLQAAQAAFVRMIEGLSPEAPCAS